MKTKIKIILIIILTTLLCSTHYSCYATTSNEKIMMKISANSSNKVLDTSITSENFLTNLDPDDLNSHGGGVASAVSAPFISIIHTIVNAIMGLIQVIGGILMVISIAVYGFGMLLQGNPKFSETLGVPGMGFGGKDGPEAKVELLKFGKNLLIGSFLLLMSSTLVKFVFNIFKM